MTARAIPVTKQCDYCGEAFETQFTKQKYCDTVCGGRAWVAANPERHRERSLRWKKANPDRARETDRAVKMRLKERDPERYFLDMWRSNLAKRGITPEEYKEMEDTQGNLCASCGRPETVTGRNGKVRRLAIDHDHETDEVRELLCQRCNLILGFAQDDPEVLALAIDYLMKHMRN